MFRTQKKIKYQKKSCCCLCHLFRFSSLFFLWWNTWTFLSPKLPATAAAGSTGRFADWFYRFSFRLETRKYFRFFFLQKCTFRKIFAIFIIASLRVDPFLLNSDGSVSPSCRRLFWSFFFPKIFGIGSPWLNSLAWNESGRVLVIELDFSGKETFPLG